MKKLHKIYYDVFIDEYTLTKDPYAPPERYIPTYKGPFNNIYIETYEVGLIEGFPFKLDNGTEPRLDIAYTQMDYFSDNYDQIRIAEAKRHNCTLKRLLYWTIPAKVFDERVTQFHLGEKQND